MPILSTAVIDGGHDYPESGAIGYRLWAQHDAVPAYPFGYGLGYTDWRYDDLAVDGDTKRGLTVDVTLANTGDRDGREIVQVYLEPEDGTLFGTPEPPRLVGYAAVDTAAGTTSTVRIDVPPATLARWNPGTGTWTAPSEACRIRVGRNAADAQLTTTTKLV